MVRMFCAVTQPDGTVIGADARSLLKKTVEDAKKAGLTFAFGTEMEFYLFRLDEDGEPTKIPYDRAGYMDIAPADRGGECPPGGLPDAGAHGHPAGKLSP